MKYPRLTFPPKLFLKIIKIFVRLCKLGYSVAMDHFWIFPNCNLDMDDYDVIDTKNSTKGKAPKKKGKAPP